jgi:hypothetical protein
MRGRSRATKQILPSRGIAETTAIDGMVYMTGRTCRRCGKGTYQETMQFDDRDGERHCTACDLGVRSKEPAGARDSACVSCGRPMRQKISPFRDCDAYCADCQKLEAQQTHTDSV